MNNAHCSQNLYLSCSQRTGRGLVQLQWRTLSSFITQTVPVCVGKEKASHVGGIWLLAPKLTVHPYPLLCARNCLPRRPRVCSHQSHVLFVPHWPVGSSPPAAVEMSVSVPAKWGTQMCVCHGEQGQMLLGTSSSHALPASLSRGRKKKSSATLLQLEESSYCLLVSRDIYMDFVGNPKQYLIICIIKAKGVSH